MVHESSNEADEESYEASEKNNEGVADQGMDVEDGDAVSQRGVSEDRFRVWISQLMVGLILTMLKQL
ncbi:hypothetical protein DPMN_009195 [Dreissena polymorpha]|uniref:Uncharacterized protein n=1 Tax=Dreissena polymorpha TaxID=45954 RepID=A0A9D4MWH3_DREPO|nr:hypothetical protein DPMN_009195 [Dreissena polymorpha]